MSDVNYDEKLRCFFDSISKFIPGNQNKKYIVSMFSEALRRACTDPVLNLNIISEAALPLSSKYWCLEHVYGVTWCMDKIFDMMQIPGFDYESFKRFVYTHMITISTTGKENMLLRAITDEDFSRAGFEKYYILIKQGKIRLFNKEVALKSHKKIRVEVTEENIHDFTPEDK